MVGKVQRLATTLHVQEPVIRLARELARRYDVTVEQLIGALILGCAERDASYSSEPTLEPHVAESLPPAAMAAESPPREPARVIPISRARRRQAGASAAAHDRTDVEARAQSVLRRSQAARAEPPLASWRGGRDR